VLTLITEVMAGKYRKSNRIDYNKISLYDITRIGKYNTLIINFWNWENKYEFVYLPN